MIRKLTVFCLTMFLLLAAFAAQAEELRITTLPSPLRPGKSERLTFVTPSAEPVTVSLLDGQGQVLLNILEHYSVVSGENFFVWNGLSSNGAPLAPGQYSLRILQGGKNILQPLEIGVPGPSISAFSVSDATIVPGKSWVISATLSMAGTLSAAIDFNGQAITVAQAQVSAGDHTLTWDGMINGAPAASGTHMLSLQLQDESGFASNLQRIVINIQEVQVTAPAESTATAESEATAESNESAQPTLEPSPAPVQTTHQNRPPTGEAVDPAQLGSSYWTLPMGNMDNEAVWKVMMQPITVVGGKDQRDTYKLRKTPDKSLKSDNILGEISFESQGVNVLETLEGGWSLVEVFNSSYGPNCSSRRGWGNTDELIKGYVETDTLKTITPRTDYGLLIDKFTQRMYVFKEGQLFSELYISTGIPTKSQPWNETPTGEFLMVSRTGDFNAGNLVCAMSMRINGGCLIHEVPYIYNEATQYKDYSSQEKQLGQKASHGCVRVQQAKNSEGLNMAWLWNNIKVNTKVLIWDDSPGRFMEYPADDLMLYYNPKGGKYYHLDQNCSSIKARFLPLPGSFPYAELGDDKHKKLEPCKYCKPPMSKEQIRELNKANGFDE